MADKTCIYFETFESLYDELPTLSAKHEFHKAIMNRGLHGIPLPTVGKDTYWEGRLTEAYRYAEELIAANERKRAAGAKGGAAKRKKAEKAENSECLKHASSNVNVNGNVNVNENVNDNINNNNTSSGMAPTEGGQPSDDKYEWEE